MRIGITQRVIKNESYHEVRDALDQRWIPLLESAGFQVVVIPNRLKNVEEYAKSLDVRGFILSGGNDLAEYGGDAPERDFTEGNLLNLAEEESIPVLGVCRGMQLMNTHFGGKLIRVENHVTPSMEINFQGKSVVVNSYHNLALDQVPEELEITGFFPPDNVVKAIKHKTLPLYGIMWHPERFDPYRMEDVELLRTIFNK